MSNTADTLPGTRQHQALLRAFIDFYAGDPRILALIVFGSLGRGDWGVYSDLDLDVLLADDVRLDVLQEVRRFCNPLTTLGERVLLIEPDGSEAADMILAIQRAGRANHPATHLVCYSFPPLTER